MPDCFIALGSNLGDRRAYLEEALRLLKKIPKTQVTAVSSCYLSDALTRDGAAGPLFLNAVCGIETRLLPSELFRALQQIENCLGRLRYESWGPRTIDLDILSYGDQRVENRHLRIPHPELAVREFVLRPLLEVANGWRHPVSKKTAMEMLEELADSPKGGKVRACCGSLSSL